jgi:ABC-type transport system involved in cytochrome bd biosynthesis fused ATPase/permease subunit
MVLKMFHKIFVALVETGIVGIGVWVSLSFFHVEFTPAVSFLMLVGLLILFWIFFRTVEKKEK